MNRGPNGSSENSIYIIDKDYRLLYINDDLKRSLPEARCGDLCYEVFCKEKAPCDGCPLKKKEGDAVLFYNKYLKKWIDVNAGTIEWPGKGMCHIIMSRAVSESDKNLFYNLTNISAYDELFELNLTKDTYKILYQVKDKYVVLPEEGRLGAALRYAAENLVHPDDKERFLDFWDGEELLSMSGECAGNTLSAHFRKKRMGGGYCWVVQTVVPLTESVNDDKVMMCFLQDIDEQKRKEESLNFRDGKETDAMDQLTGLYRRSAFFEKGEYFLREAENGQYCMMAVDIEHFKLFNEWYGQEAGDLFLVNIGTHLLNAQNESRGIAGYLGDDDFAIILPNDCCMIERLQEQIMGYVRQYGGNAGFLPAFGMYLIDDRTISVSTMYDRAVIALAEVKGNYARRVCWYDTKMMRKMEENHLLLMEVQRALENGEFTFYAQPKCNMATGRIVGLESLVRWVHPERGIISPGDFIPMLEENGFITDLDMYIWEKVCISLRNWIVGGHRPIPVSVNVSRLDFYTLDVTEVFTGLVERYKIEPRLLEIEITESAYVEEYQMISKVVDRLRKAGFTVLMDDFGSGYSSLNMLKDVNVDVLKLDMKFLDINEESAKKSLGILEAITSMSRFMGMRMIAEGVETEEQMNLLLDMGCLYGQGYYFYRPMPISVFEPLLAEEDNIDFRGIKAKKTERLRIRDLINDDLFSESLLNNILGGIAFYDVCGEDVELLRVNEQYYKVIGMNPVDLEEHRKEILQYIYEADQEVILGIFEEAYRNVLKGAEGDVRRMKGDGGMIWMHFHAFFLREQDGHRMYYGSISDVTEQKHRERQLESSQRALAAVVNVSDNDASFMKLTEENRRVAACIFSQMTPGGMLGGYCEEGFPLYFANYEMVQLLGYSSYDEFAEAIDYKVVNTIHPDDLDRVSKDIGSEYYEGLEYTTMYRMPKRDGSWFWTLDKGRVVRAEDGRLAIVSACTDISDTMASQQELVESNARLLRQNQELYFINNDMPGGYHRCSPEPGYEFLYISNRFLDILGYTREEIRERFDNKFMNMVHPDDRKMVENGVQGVKKGKISGNLEYRMLSKNRGYIWVIDQSRYLKYGGTRFIQGVLLDVTETVELRNNMKLLEEHMVENILLIEWKDGKTERKVIADGLSRSIGYSREEYEKELQEEGYTSLIVPVDWERLNRGAADALKRREDYGDVVEMKLKDGSRRWVQFEICYVSEDNGVVRYMCTCRDVTSIKQKEQELYLIGQKMESILKLAKVNSWDWDIETGRLVMSNINFKEVVIDPFPEQMLESRRISEKYKRRILDYVEKIKNSEAPETVFIEMPVTIGPEETIWLKSACEIIKNEAGVPVKAAGYFVDITEQKKQYLKSKESIRALEIDSLTGLFNRQTAIPRIKKYLEEEKEGSAALIMFDLDNFKVANDVFGHAYGDSMITRDAGKLKKAFGKDDVMCRIGGDEFLILCKNICEDDVNKKLSSVITDMVTACRCGDQEIKFTVSAGYAMTPEDGTEFDELYRKADIALFTAKLGGKSSYRKYEPSMKAIRYELADNLS